MPENNNELTPKEIGALLEDAGIQQQQERNRRSTQEQNTEKSFMKKILRWFR